MTLVEPFSSEGLIKENRVSFLYIKINATGDYKMDSGLRLDKYLFEDMRVP